MEFVINITSRLRFQCVWIGLNDRRTENKFVWSDGTHFNSSTYHDWNGGEPNNLGREDCVELRNHKWNDLTCYHYCYYVCETTTKGFFIVVCSRLFCIFYACII